MTVKELKEFLKDIPDDVEIILQRATEERPIFKYVKTKILSGIEEKVLIY